VRIAREPPPIRKGPSVGFPLVRAVVAVVAVLGALGARFVLGQTGSAAPASGSAPSLVFVTIDTLRADHVGAYGYAPAETPSLDRLAQRGVLLEDAVVQVPQTRPSHVSIFTGRHPYEHGVRDNYSAPLDARTPTLASLLRGRGYDTAAFIGAYPVSRSSGLAHGFATFDDPFEATEGVSVRDVRTERRGSEVVDRALAWLVRPRTSPFFLWVHLFDPHAPYEPPAPYGQRFARQPYDGEVAYADAQLGRLLDALERAGRTADTLVVVTSDHGEGLGDHGEDEHLLFLYDSTLRVPLVLSWPGRLPAAARLRGQFRSVDLLPTLLDLLGLPAAPTSGESRGEALRRGSRIADNESYAESLYGQLHFGYAPLRALRGEGWKLIDAPRPELYRISDDPGEQKNLAETRAQVASAMRDRLAGHDLKRDAAVSTAPVDPAAAERLAALGYVGGNFFKGGKPSGADPKDKIAEYQAYRRDSVKALRLYREGDFDGAIDLLARLSRSSTVSFNVEYYLGLSLLEKGRAVEAVRPLEKAVESAPTAVPAHAALVRALLAAGRVDQAKRAVERGLEAAPANPELTVAMGALLLRQGKTAEGEATLQKARALDPRSAFVRIELAMLYRNRGDLARSAVEAEEAVALDPKSPAARVARGLVRGAQGREAEAAREFRAALDLDPKYADALFYLASVELRAGRAAQARPLLERLIKTAPAYPGAREALALATPSSRPPGEGQVHLRLMRVRTRSLADELTQRLAAGEEFAALARARSDDASAPRGGDLGAVRLVDLAEPLRSAAAALAPGQVSAVVETTNGYVILKREP